MPNRDAEILNDIDEELLDEQESEENDMDQELLDELKEEERRKKAEVLWNDVQAGNTKHLITKVASILNRYPDTRNSDVALMIKYWKVFEGHTGNSFDLNKLFEYERLTSITRARAKIQNEYGLFKADKKIRKYRQNQEETQKEIQIATKPEVEYISIFADESGKNDDFAIVGSVWVLAEEGKLNSEIVDWVQERKKADSTCPDEFHFNKIRNNYTNLQVYKDFINFVVAKGYMIGFKGIAVNQTKLNMPIDEINTELFYQMVRIGIEHEKETGRIVLPKQVAYFKDKEDGESALRISQIQQSLVDNFKVHYDEDIRLNTFMSIDSRTNRLIQVADLFTAAINRVLNHQRKNPDSANAKDEFANYVFDLLNVESLQYNAAQLQDVSGQAETDLATLYIFD